MFALQYIAANDGIKVSYRSPLDEQQRSNAAIKRKLRSRISQDNESLLGPPDKKQHFNGGHQKKKYNDKTQDKELTVSKKEVEVLYDNGIWYKGWLSSFNFETGKWIVKFYDDNETTEVNFPDKDVRVLNK